MFKAISAGIIGAVVIIGGMAISDANSAPVTPRPMEGKHIPSGSTLETVAGFNVTYIKDGKCYDEFWLLPREYTGINHFLYDGHKDATPDSSFVRALEGCVDGYDQKEAYDRYTNMWMDGGKRWIDGKEMVS